MNSINPSFSPVTRREFLKASGLTAGGLIIGVSLPVGTKASDGPGGFEPSPFIYIESNGDTTLYCGRCEMGQGISTALPVEGSESGLFGSH